MIGSAKSSTSSGTFTQRLTKRILVITVIAVGVATLAFIRRTADDILYTQPLSSRYKFTIRTERNSSHDMLHVTYHPGIAIGTYVEDTLVVRRPNEDWSFAAVYDAGTETDCIYDRNNAGVVILFHRPTEDLWMPARIGGWGGTKRPVWEMRFQAVKQAYPKIPYNDLPERFETPPQQHGFIQRGQPEEVEKGQ